METTVKSTLNNGCCSNISVKYHNDRTYINFTDFYYLEHNSKSKNKKKTLKNTFIIKLQKHPNNKNQ